MLTGGIAGVVKRCRPEPETAQARKGCHMAETEKKTSDTGQDIEIEVRDGDETAAEAEAAAGEGGADTETTESTKETSAPAAEKDGSGKTSKSAGKNSREKAMQEKIDGLEDKVKRQMAEFDNFRKRTDKEKEQMFSMGEKNVIEKLLPIVDNFERGLAAVSDDEKDGAFVSGMEKIYKQLVKQLEDLGVKPIEAVGKEFDPNFHNAVMQVESDEYETGVVAQEFQKGYLYHDSVLRHSMVGVVK